MDDDGQCPDRVRTVAHRVLLEIRLITTRTVNNARDHFPDAAGVYDTNGNPTPTLSELLKDGGQFAPQTGGSGAGNVYISAKWQFNCGTTTCCRPRSMRCRRT